MLSHLQLGVSCSPASQLWLHTGISEELCTKALLPGSHPNSGLAGLWYNQRFGFWLLLFISFLSGSNMQPSVAGEPFH